MLRASAEYKQMMNKPMRNRGYVSVSLGVVNQSAQSDASVTSTLAPWSNGDIFGKEETTVKYGTMEQNWVKADGTSLFLPEIAQYKTNGICTSTIEGTLRIKFGNTYAIKGLTIEFFEDCYPTDFDLNFENHNDEYNYTNDTPHFSTEDNLGNISYLEIIPNTMSGGEQRLRVKSIVMGVGLVFANDVVESCNIGSYVSPISADVSYVESKLTVFDVENKFSVDNDASFISFLEPMQPLKISMGVDLDNGTKEWKQIATLFLKDWSANGNKVTFTASDRLGLLVGEYDGGATIHTRTAYAEFTSILQSAGLTLDDYSVDTFLSGITFTNPMPSGNYRDCLQILANATRCVIVEDENGKINVKANFATVLDPTDLTVTSDNKTVWSNPTNILYSTGYEYGDMTFNSIKASGETYFLPENSNYIDTSYVSNSIADANGEFTDNPSVTIELPATYSYYEVNITFGDVVPELLTIKIWKNSTLVNTFTYTNLSKNNSISENFVGFNKIEFIVSKTKPHARVLINRVSFGNATDYRITKDLMTDRPIGSKEDRIKEVWVKIYTYENDSDGNAQEVDDRVYCVKTLNTTGDIKYVENPLISTRAQASLVGEWIANYYLNDVSYDISYRGDPRVQASDIIGLESDYLTNLQVVVVEHNLTFNGAFSGTINARRDVTLNTISTRYETLDLTESSLQQRVSTLEDNVPFAFGVDEDGNYGYVKAGADTVTPFKASVHGTASWNGNTSITVTVGFRPSLIVVKTYYDSSRHGTYVWNTLSTSYTLAVLKVDYESWGSTSYVGYLQNITVTDTGFTFAYYISTNELNGDIEYWVM